MRSFEQSAITAPYAGATQQEIEEMEKRRPGRQRPFAEQVLMVTFVFAFLAFTAAGCLVYGVWIIIGNPDPLAAFLIAVGIGAVVGYRKHGERVAIYDEQETVYSEYVKFRQNQQKEKPKVQPYAYQAMGKPKRINIGNFRFTEKEWRKLAVLLQKNDWKVTRRPLTQSGLFTNVNDNYRDIAADFADIGWLPDGSEGNDYLTEDGKEFFVDKLPPAPSSTGASSGATGATTTTTTGGDG